MTTSEYERPPLKVGGNLVDEINWDLFKLFKDNEVGWPSIAFDRYHKEERHISGNASLERQHSSAKKL